MVRASDVIRKALYRDTKASVTRGLTTMLRPVLDQSHGKIASRSHTSARQVLVIGNSSINKVGSREVFEHFHEPGSAVDDNSRCIHVFKSFLVLLQLDRMKMQKKGGRVSHVGFF